MNLGLPAIALSDLKRASFPLQLCSTNLLRWHLPPMSASSLVHSKKKTWILKSARGVLPVGVDMSRSVCQGGTGTHPFGLKPCMIANLSAHVGLLRIASRYPSKNTSTYCCRWPQHFALVLIVNSSNQCCTATYVLFEKQFDMLAALPGQTMVCYIYVSTYVPLCTLGPCQHEFVN